MSRARYHVTKESELVATFVKPQYAIEYARFLSEMSGRYCEVTRPALSEVFAQFNDGVASREFAHLNRAEESSAPDYEAQARDSGWYWHAEESEWRKPYPDASDGYQYASTAESALAQDGLN